MKRKPKFRIGSRLAPSRVVRLSEFFPDEDWTDDNLGLEIFRSQHPRVLDGFVRFQSDPEFAAFFASTDNGAEAPEVDLDNLATLRDEQLERAAVFLGATIIGRLVDFPTEQGPLTIEVEDEDRDEFLKALLAELPTWFTETCFKRAAAQEQQLQAKAEEIAGKS